MTLKWRRIRNKWLLSHTRVFCQCREHFLIWTVRAKVVACSVLWICNGEAHKLDVLQWSARLDTGSTFHLLQSRPEIARATAVKTLLEQYTARSARRIHAYNNIIWRWARARLALSMFSAPHTLHWNWWWILIGPCPGLLFWSGWWIYYQLSDGQQLCSSKYNGAIVTQSKLLLLLLPAPTARHKAPS